MAYCSKCGNEIKEGSRYCDSCGNEIQKSERVVEIMTCPQCGALINILFNKCESCGTEFRGLHTSKSIKEFAEKIAVIASDKQRIFLIKSFPIPNTKEDIVDYMVLASTHIGYSGELYKCKEAEEYEKAWVAKFFQAYEKARLVFENDKDFSRVQEMYENTLVRIENIERERNKKAFQRLVVKNLGIICGELLLFSALVMDNLKVNAAMIELVGVIVLIVSSSTLKKRNAENVEFALAVGCGFATIVLSFLFENGSMVMVGGVITIIACLICFLNNKNSSR